MERTSKKSERKSETSNQRKNVKGLVSASNRGGVWLREKERKGVDEVSLSGVMWRHSREKRACERVPGWSKLHNPSFSSSSKQLRLSSVCWVYLLKHCGTHLADLSLSHVHISFCFLVEGVVSGQCQHSKIWLGCEQKCSHLEQTHGLGLALH